MSYEEEDPCHMRRRIHVKVLGETITPTYLYLHTSRYQKERKKERERERERERESLAMCVYSRQLSTLSAEYIEFHTFSHLFLIVNKLLSNTHDTNYISHSWISLSLARSRARARALSLLRWVTGSSDPAFTRDTGVYSK
jgi:Mn2+/Fe2+ NRAMP family transporter